MIKYDCKQSITFDQMSVCRRTDKKVKIRDYSHIIPFDESALILGRSLFHSRTRTESYCSLETVLVLLLPLTTGIFAKIKNQFIVWLLCSYRWNKTWADRIDWLITYLNEQLILNLIDLFRNTRQKCNQKILNPKWFPHFHVLSLNDSRSSVTLYADSCRDSFWQNYYQKIIKMN